MSDPRELPEWLQIEAEAVEADRRRAARGRFARCAAIAIPLAAGLALGVRALLTLA